MKSILLTSIPKYDLVAPPAAIGVLQGVAQDNNLNTEVFDFNLFLHKSLSDQEWQELDNWCVFITHTISKKLEDKIIELWDSEIAKRLPPGCEHLLMSVFSYWSLYIARLLIVHENTKVRPYKLIVGGNGVVSKFPDTGQYFTDWNKENNFIENLIVGDGEKPLAEMFNEGKVKYDNDTLDSFPFPSYEGYNLDDYQEKKVYITGSRGCVRKCTFCDIYNIWPKFRYRSAESIVNEMKSHYENHGVTRFDFTDSLINGSVSNFYKFNTLLAEAKAKDSNLKDIVYLGQAICRPRNQMPESHYEAMYYAGCKQLTIGIESFSNSVRDHMKKKFSDRDIHYHLEQCKYWNIPNVFLMITGYPTETLMDHQKNISDIEKYKDYAQMGIIEMIRWGTTMHLIGDTPITSEKNVRELGLKGSDNDQISGGELATYNWTSDANPNLDLRERIRRRLELHEKSVECGYPQPRVKAELQTIYDMAKLLDKSQ